MSKKNQSKHLAMAFAIWSALFMLALWLLARLGIYVSAAEMMMEWHIFFNLTFVGLITGMIEAAFVSYFLVISFMGVYSRLQKRSK